MWTYRMVRILPRMRIRMEIKKSMTFTTECVDMTSSALGVCKVESFPVFVSNMLVGEQGDVLILKKLSKYGFGKLVNLTKSSSHRQEPRCPLFLKCGGCQTMHLSEAHQLEFKRNQVSNDLKRNGNLEVEVSPVIGMEHPYFYRNKVMIPVSFDPFEAGFYRVNSHSIVDMDTCFIQHPLLNTIYQSVKEFIKEHQETSVQTIVLRIGQNTQEVMVALAINQLGLKHEEQFVKVMSESFPEIKSMWLNLHDQPSNTVLSRNSRLIYGSKTITERLHDLKFSISLNSFFQVNTTQTEILYETAIRLASLNHEDTVLDLYCGVGTIALFLSRFVKRVIGVDIVESAIEDATKNAALNGIDTVEFVCQDATEYIKSLKDSHEVIDAVFVDPPRKGLSQQGIEDLLLLKAKQIVYISCNPQTLGRDLKHLSTEYTIDVVQPVDLFPWTSHVETVVLMSRVEK